MYTPITKMDYYELKYGMQTGNPAYEKTDDNTKMYYPDFVQWLVDKIEMTDKPPAVEKQCSFQLAWMGKCNNPALTGSDYCEEHAKEKCVSCGEQATHQCAETGGLVCGAPLCDECTHTIVEEGHNGMMFGTLPKGLKSHDKKWEQIYKPWYMRRTFTHKVYDAILQTNEYQGTEEECEAFIAKQTIHDTKGMEVKKLTKQEIQALEAADKMHTKKTIKELYGI